MAKAKMVSDYSSMIAERELDKYCLMIAERQVSESPMNVNSFVGDVAKVQILDALGLYNGEEL